MEKKFGDLVKKYRGDRTLKEIADKLSITSAYVCDIERGNRYPSKVVIDRMVEFFSLEGERKNEFYDLAAIETPKKQAVSTDIINYIMTSSALRNLIRVAKCNQVKEEFWETITKELIKE